MAWIHFRQANYARTFRLELLHLSLTRRDIGCCGVASKISDGAHNRAAFSLLQRIIDAGPHRKRFTGRVTNNTTSPCNHHRNMLPAFAKHLEQLPCAASAARARTFAQRGVSFCCAAKSVLPAGRAI